jgi:type II secretory pathway pseudopilin PulG
MLDTMASKNIKETDTNRKNRAWEAFTLVELMVVFTVMAILAALLLPGLGMHKTHITRNRCGNNLKNVGLAFRVFATDNMDRFPMAISASEGGSSDAMNFDKPTLVFRHFLVMSNELSTPKVVVCPMDKRTEASLFSTNSFETIDGKKGVPFLGPRNVSYFIGLNANEANPLSILAGDRNLMVHPGQGVTRSHTNISFSTTSLFGTNTTSAGWSSKEMHLGQGNIALSDGSVRQSTQAILKDIIKSTGDDKMALMFPGDEEKP